MTSLKVVKFSSTHTLIEHIQIFVCFEERGVFSFTNKNNTNTWHAKISLASCQVSVFGDDDGLFPWLFNTDSRRIEVSHSWRKRPTLQSRQGWPPSHWFFQRQ